MKAKTLPLGSKNLAEKAVRTHQTLHQLDRSLEANAVVVKGKTASENSHRLVVTNLSLVIRNSTRHSMSRLSRVQRNLNQKKILLVHNNRLWQPSKDT